MQDMRKPAMLVALLSAVGIGCYTWGQHKAADSTAPVPSPYPMAAQSPILSQPNGVQPSAINPSSMADQSSNSIGTTKTMPGTQTFTQTTSTASAVPVAPGVPLTQVNPNASIVPAMATGVQGQPVAAVPYAGTTTVTPVESTTVIEKKTVVSPTTHTAYTQHTVHYKHHKTDKVHIARATKHGVMFALKLPGRAAF